MLEPTATPALVRALPLVGLTAIGLGPLASPAKKPVDVETFVSSQRGTQLALESAGVVARRVIALTQAFGGEITAERLRFHTVGLDPDLLRSELDRLVAARLVSLDADGTVCAAPGVAGLFTGTMRSLNDHQAISSDGALAVCRRLGIAAPTRKGERIAAIADHFADPDTAELARKRLSAAARRLLARIASLAGPFVADRAAIGLYSAHFLPVEVRRYRHRELPDDPESKQLGELIESGFVGVDQWTHTLWIWKEAVPALDAPFYPDWMIAPRPGVIACPATDGPGPAFVSIVDRALRHWAQHPPPVLKNGDRRLAKTVVASTAKALAVDAAATDLAARLVIDIGLVLPNTISTSGRGRNRTVERAWLGDPVLMEAWESTPTVQRWARLVAAWCHPGRFDGINQLVCNRHLTLWELANLEPGTGYNDAEAFGAWVGDRHASLGVAEAVAEVLIDLRILGLVASAGPLALTGLGRRLLEDPSSVDEVSGSTTQVVVQGDLTVLAPPGLDHDIRHRLAELTVVESDGAAQVLRLDEARITRAAQGGATADELIGFLRDVSSVPLTDTVTRLVVDAASRAGRVTLMAATTVVIVSDPADLVAVCRVKAAALTPIADTVAVSTLPPAKVQAALDRKGLAPVVKGKTGAKGAGGAADTPARSASDETSVERLLHHADSARRHAETFNSDIARARAEQLARRAAELRDPHLRLKVDGPLTLIPESRR